MPDGADISKPMANGNGFPLSDDALKACRDIWDKHRSIVRKIVEAVAYETGIPAKKITSQDRTALVSRARQIVMYEARQSGLSYPQIGKALGLDHTTVRHGVFKEEKRRRA